MIAGSSLALVALAVLGVALLRPSASAPDRAPASSTVVLVDSSARKPLPDVGAETLFPPPPALELTSLRGTLVVIDVWASWCVPCREEAPTLARLAREHATRVRFVGIDTQDARSDGRAFVRRYALAFPHLFDPKSRLATKLGVFGIPTMFLVDREGRIAATLVGKQGETRLRRYLRLLTGEGEASAGRVRERPRDHDGRGQPDELGELRPRERELAARAAGGDGRVGDPTSPLRRPEKNLMPTDHR